MDFSNRSSQPQPVAPHTPASAPVTAPSSPHKQRRDDSSKLFKVVSGILLVCIVILIAASVTFIAFGGNTNENQFVQPTKLQAVFLNTGQVYFGNIKAINNEYFRLTNIFYLQTSSASGSTTSSSTNTNVSLVKLGCELHAPYDQMIINSSQVTFWENLQPSGQVAQAVATFEKQNPHGQKCSDQSAAPAGTTSTSTGSVQGTSTTGTSTTTGDSDATN